jgi:hypothetical protein
MMLHRSSVVMSYKLLLCDAMLQNKLFIKLYYSAALIMGLGCFIGINVYKYSALGCRHAVIMFLCWQAGGIIHRSFIVV